MDTTQPQPPPIRPRLTVVSPFVDKSHGTERVLAEQIERLSSDYEIHLYSERVDDVDLEEDYLAPRVRPSRSASFPISMVVCREPCQRRRGTAAGTSGNLKSSTRPV